MRKSINGLLSGGDRRSIGKVEQVIALVESDPELFAELINEILNSNPVIAMRAADATEKLSAIYPEWLSPHKKFILTKLIRLEQKEVRWHVAQILSRLTLTTTEATKVAATLTNWLESSDSRIVQVMSLQGLVNLTRQHPQLRSQVMRLVEVASKSPIPALRSRSKKLLRGAELTKKKD